MKLSITIALLLICTTLHGQKKMPGVTAVDVYGNFTKIGFKLEKISNSEGMLWTATSEDPLTTLTVETYGPSQSDIRSVRATARGKQTAEALRFLVFTATLQYNGCNQTQAKEWTTNHVVSGGTTTIGNVRFTLRTPSSSVKILIMEGI